jgi:hypothetical protein
VRGLDHIGCDDQVVVEELAAQRVVGDDTTDLRCRQKHRLRPHLRKPAEHRGLIAQIDFASAHRQQFDVLLRQPAHQRRADHPAMAGHEYGLAFQLKRGCCHRRPPRTPCRRSDRLPRGGNLVGVQRTVSNPKQPCSLQRRVGIARIKFDTDKPRTLRWTGP